MAHYTSHLMSKVFFGTYPLSQFECVIFACADLPVDSLHDSTVLLENQVLLEELLFLLGEPDLKLKSEQKRE